MARKKRSQSPRDPVVYELRSVNLSNLPEKEQGAVLDRFASFLDSLTEPITFHIVQDEREVGAVGALYQIPYKRFFVEAPSQADSLILKLGTRMTRVHAVPSIKTTRIHPKYIVDSEGRYVQTYCVTRLGGALHPGFLAELYPVAHSIMVDVEPIDIYEAKKTAKAYAKSVGSRLVLRQTEGRSLDPEEQAEFQRASGAAQLIGMGRERLFRTRIRIVLRAASYEGLVEARKKLRQVVGGMVGQIDSPAYLQKALLKGVGPKYATGRWFFITTSGALGLFPFCGLDVVDPSGVFLGQNLQTGNGILYDVFEKENYNVALMGQSVDYSAPLIYRQNGQVKREPIGKAIDRYFKDRQEGPVYTSSLEVYSFDPITLETGWAPVQYVFRHRYRGKLLKLKLQTGRTITVTPNHSIFVLRGGHISHIKGAEISQGDFVVGTADLKHEPAKNVVVDLLDELAKVDGLEIRGLPLAVYKRISRLLPPNQLRQMRTRRALPVKLAQNLLDEDRRAAYLGYKGANVNHALTLEIDEGMARLLGYYAAEGHIRFRKGECYGIELTLGRGDRAILKDALSILYFRFGIKAKVVRHGENGLRLKFSDRVLLELFRKWVGTGTSEKVMPNLLFNSPSNVRKDFLRAWIAGDCGCTVSREFMNGVLYLLLLEGCIATASERDPSSATVIKGRKVVGKHQAYNLEFPKPPNIREGRWTLTRRRNEPRYPCAQLPTLLSAFDLHVSSGSTRKVTPRSLARLDSKLRRLVGYEGTRTKNMNQMRRDGFYRRHVNKYFERKGGWLQAKSQLLALKSEFENVKKLATSGLAFLEVLQVEEVSSSSDYVYDVSVPGRENFLAGFGGIFCHNTGFGKSTFVKTFLARMLNQDRDMMVFLFDSIVRPEYAVAPDGSYEKSFAGITGCTVRRFNGEKGAGLDPFAVFPEKRMAANFLASVAKVEGDQDLLDDLYLTSQRASSVPELVELAPADLKKRLQANLPPYRFLFEGEMEIFPRMVFVLYDLPPGEIRDAAAFLALSAVWRKIQDKAIPEETRKAIVIDEGWSLVEINPRTGRPYFPLAVEYVPEIARTGRHYRTAFVIATQLVSDLMGRGGSTGPGRVIIESCSTKIVLKQDQAATQVLKEAFNLSGGEEKFIVNAKIGQGILVTQEGRIPFYNFLSDEERRLFTTKPKEVMA